MTGETILYGACIGVLATVTMDVLGSVARRIGLTVGAKGIWVGRWYLGIGRGQLVQRIVVDAPEQPGEKRAAMVGHFSIGSALAVAYVIAAGWFDVSPSGVLLALGYGLATTVFPLFLVYPALGFGWLGMKGPPELRPIRTSLLNHLFYGFGIWWSAAVLPVG